MCLGLVGRVVAIDADHPDVARVDVGGSEKRVHVGLIEEPLAAGDWVSIHLGLAMEKLSADDAAGWLEAVRLMGPDDGSGLDDPIGPSAADGAPATVERP